MRIRPLSVVRSASLVLFGLAALGCGEQGPRDAGADQGVRAAPDSAAARKPCEDFTERLCSHMANELSETCVSLRATVELLAPEACEVALANTEASYRALGRRPMSCDALRAKFCADTRDTPKACDKIKQHSKRFTEARCTELLGRYDQALVDLKQGLRFPTP